MSNSYPLLDITWTILIVFAWVLYIWVAVTCLLDIFRRDMSGFAKVLWTLVIIIFSWLGVLLYLLINHRGMTERRMKDEQLAQAQFQDAVKKAAGTGGPASELQTAKQLLDSGTIDQAEYDRLKAKVLAS
jgi:Phospholipase_D-nuclease N-terminal/Short C-terminal domain